MESIFSGLKNFKTTIIAILIFLVGVLPEIKHVGEVLLHVLQTGDVMSFGQLYSALTSLIATIGFLLAKDASTGSRP